MNTQNTNSKNKPIDINEIIAGLQPVLAKRGKKIAGVLHGDKFTPTKTPTK
jgi:hypothetical protein